MTNDLLAADHARLLEHFRNLGIDTSQPGFYDDPKFLEQERLDPEYLNLYARFVETRPIDEEYRRRAHELVPIASSILYRELVAEGRLGACADLSMVLSRILERQGIWNYMVRGSLTISFPTHLSISKTYFWSEGRQPVPGHVWVAAPPFPVVDLTVGQQPYPNPKVARGVPGYVVEDSPQIAAATSEDLFSPELRQMAKQRGVSNLLADAPPIRRKFVEVFPALVVRRPPATLKYVPFATSASEGALEAIENQRWNGRFGHQVYTELVLPALTDPE